MNFAAGDYQSSWTGNTLKHVGIFDPVEKNYMSVLGFFRGFKNKTCAEYRLWLDDNGNMISIS
jgi:hypothetical protein